MRARGRLRAGFGVDKGVSWRGAERWRLQRGSRDLEKAQEAQSITDANGRAKMLGMSAVVTGTVAALVSAAALAALAKAEGKGALQPLNATSHWAQGDAAAKVELPSASHTLVGFAAHHLSAIFWAAPFEAWLAANPPRTLMNLLRDAFVMSGIAWAVDYGATPKRFTPGWELALSKKSMFASYVALAFGLVAGPFVSGQVRESTRTTLRDVVPRRLARLARA